MKQIFLLLFLSAFSSLNLALNPSDFEFKRHIIVPKKGLSKVSLDAHVITRLNPGYSNIALVNDERKLVPFRITPLESFDLAKLDLIPPLPGTLENPNATSFYIKSPKAPLYGLKLDIIGTLPIEHKVTIYGFMLNPNEKRPVGQNFTKIALSDSRYNAPLFRPITYPYYEISITPKLDIGLKSVYGSFKNHAIFFKNKAARSVTLYYGSTKIYPIQKIHDPSIQIKSKKVQNLKPEPYQENASYDDPEKLKSAWKNPRLYLILIVILVLLGILNWVKKRQVK